MLCPKCNTECSNGYCSKCGIFSKTDVTLMPKTSPHENDLDIEIDKLFSDYIKKKGNN